MSSSSELVARRGSVVRDDHPTFAPSFPEVPGADMWNQEAPAGRWHDGHAEGYAVGRQDAYRAAEESLTRLDDLASALSAAVVDVRASRATALQATAADLAEAAVTLARAVLGKVVPVGEEVAVAVATALAFAPPEVAAAVHLHPEDIDLVHTELFGPAVHVVADPGVPPGGCSVVVGAVVIDGGLAAAVDRARASLLGEGVAW